MSSSFLRPVFLSLYLSSPPLCLLLCSLSQLRMRTVRRIGYLNVSTVMPSGMGVPSGANVPTGSAATEPPPTGIPSTFLHGISSAASNRIRVQMASGGDLGGPATTSSKGTTTPQQPSQRGRHIQQPDLGVVHLAQCELGTKVNEIICVLFIVWLTLCWCW